MARQGTAKEAPKNPTSAVHNICAKIQDTTGSFWSFTLLQACTIPLSELQVLSNRLDSSPDHQLNTFPPAVRSHTITDALCLDPSDTMATLNINPDCVSGRSICSGGALGGAIAMLRHHSFGWSLEIRQDAPLSSLQPSPHTTALG
jgi:hypothetical protein